MLTHCCSAWSELNHLFVDEADKDACKACFGYTSVPFYVVFDEVGSSYFEVPRWLLVD
jgi:hypothetical protein